MKNLRFLREQAKLTVKDVAEEMQVSPQAVGKWERNESFPRAEQLPKLADLYHCKAALLKENSPSCGSGKIYDGTFTGTLVEGDGITAQLLKQKGIQVYGESEIRELVDERPFYYSI